VPVQVAGLHCLLAFLSVAILTWFNRVVCPLSSMSTRRERDLHALIKLSIVFPKIRNLKLLNDCLTG